MELSEEALAFPTKALSFVGEVRERMATKQLAARARAVRSLLDSDPNPHVSEIYEALEQDRDAYRDSDPEGNNDDPVAVLTELTDRFAVGMISADEYDRTLRRALGLSGHGCPTR